MNSQIRFFIQTLGSLGCFWWLFQMVSPELLFDSLKKSNYLFVVLITAIMVPAVLARAWRWHYILTRGGIPVSMGSITNATFIGMALNLILPASAGDVVRSYYSWQKYGHKEEMLASTLADKAVALISLFLLGAVGGFMCGETKLAMLAAILIIPAGLILIVPVRWLWNILALLVNRVLKKDLDVDLLLRSFHMSLSTFFGAMFISIVGWMITNLMYFLAVSSVGAHVGMGYVFAIAPSVNILRMLPISISGLGSADALMVQLLGVVGVEQHLTLAASMIVNMTLIVIPGIIGAVLMLVNARSLNKAVILKQAAPNIDV
ncbi:MAG: flippase-like domain-containing protein [Deltaproteobacteria bacterium]|nr:flippase-like domain-containing protein [Deltaproteobacteria bacterium]